MRGLLALVVWAFGATSAVAGDPMFDEVAAGDKTAVEQALPAGQDVDGRAPDQATPLINAALAGQLAIAELLLSKGAGASEAQGNASVGEELGRLRREVRYHLRKRRIGDCVILEQLQSVTKSECCG